MKTETTSTVIFNKAAYTQDELDGLTTFDLIELYNEVLDELHDNKCGETDLMAHVKRFADRKTALKRVWNILLKWDDCQNKIEAALQERHDALEAQEIDADKVAAELAAQLPNFPDDDAEDDKPHVSTLGAELAKMAENQKPKKAKHTPIQRKERSNRGTNLLPPGFAPIPTKVGSKQEILARMLHEQGGVTMDDLIRELGKKGKPWTEATVRSGFGWDMKLKGYGVKSRFDNGIEFFELVIPEGYEFAG